MQSAVLGPPAGEGSPEGEARTLQVARCDDVEDFRDCHTRYPTGCTLSATGDYDTYLNLLKNQIRFPASPSPVMFLSSKEEFQDLDQQVLNLPQKLTSRNHVKLKEALDGMGEHQLRGTVGFLYSVKVEKGGSGETSNCKLKDDEEEVDFHLGIGFDPDLAARLRAAVASHKKPTPSDRREMRQNNIIVEMTPHYRFAFRPGWTADALTPLLGRQVKVVGQLLADNEHNIRSQNCALPDATEDCWRASLWELHPVTQFQVCKSSNSCDLNSNDWEDLETLSP
jgi:hypothetical protein